MSKVIVIMGVSGTGKTTVGKLLSDKTNIPFFDADDFHPKANISKMRAGLPLNDADREPWLTALAQHIKNWSQRPPGAILACSSLKASYRKTLSSFESVAISWIFLTGSFELLSKRMKARADHFMPPALLKSQLETLEAPDQALKLDISASPVEIVDQIISKLQL